MSWSRENTWRGCEARKKSRSNSFAVSRSCSPCGRASRVAGVELEAVEGQRALESRRRVAPAEHGAHARRQLARREGLGDVVVGAELEPDDPVGLFAARRQHDHGQVAARPDPPAQRQPVGAGQHHVEDDEVGWAAFDQLPRGVAVARLDRVKAVALEVAGDNVAHDRLVVDDQHRRHRIIVAVRHARSTSGGARAPSRGARSRR